MGEQAVYILSNSLILVFIRKIMLKCYLYCENVLTMRVYGVTFKVTFGVTFIFRLLPFGVTFF